MIVYGGQKAPREIPGLTLWDLARFDSKIERTDGCWLWRGQINKRHGYGVFWLQVAKFRAHRIAYELHHGPLAGDKVIDHLCRNRACVNPDHLEAVTQRENLLRGDTLAAACAAKTHCPRGHAYDDVNTYIEKSRYGLIRRCRVCRREQRAQRRAA